jgi:release factor glutamine methyltransferase
MSSEKRTWNRLQLLEWTTKFLREKGIESARLDAEVLLAHVLGTTRLNLYVHYDEVVAPDALARYHDLNARRGRREPLRYILGYTEFLSLRLAVDKRVLIPRPETELLAERAITLLSKELPPGEKTVVDMGTGSGCIAVAIAKNFPDVVVHATDCSADALAVARENARSLGVQDQVRFHQGNLLEPVAELAGKVHLIAANPPYVPEKEYETLAPELHYEPRQAVAAGPTGLEVIAALVSAAPALLKPGGVLLCEIGAGEAHEVRHLVEQSGAYGSPTIHRDYASIERILEARTHEAPGAPPASDRGGSRR